MPVDVGQPVLAIVGPTASGKTALSLEIAEQLGGPNRVEIISADAMQLYRGMDVGTAKLPVAERRGIAHHQLDVLDVTDEASVAAYQEQARADLENVAERGKIPLLVGGSGLYVSGVLDELEFPGTDPNLREELNARAETEGLEPLIAQLTELDPVSARTINLKNPRRVIRALEVVLLTGRSYTPVFPRHTSHYARTHIIGAYRQREILNEAIARRAASMFDGGLLEETAELIDLGLRSGATARKATGYAQAIAVLDGDMNVDEAIDSTAQGTRRLAKKQRTWFKRDQRIDWRDLSSLDRSPEADDDARLHEIARDALVAAKRAG